MRILWCLREEPLVLRAYRRFRQFWLLKINAVGCCGEHAVQVISTGGAFIHHWEIKSMLSMQALKSAEEQSTHQMLVRGWLIRKPVANVEMAAEEPASRGFPPWHPHIRPTETKRGHSLNQGAKIMCINQSAMRAFGTGETQAGDSDVSRTSRSQRAQEMLEGLSLLGNEDRCPPSLLKGGFRDDLAVWRHRTSVWHDRVVFDRFHQSQQKLWNYWRYRRVRWEMILRGCEVRLCVIQDRSFQELVSPTFSPFFMWI